MPKFENSNRDRKKDSKKKTSEHNIYTSKHIRLSQNQNSKINNQNKTK